MGIFTWPLNLCREEKIVERAKALKVSAGTDPEADLGPVISKQVSWPIFILNRICFKNSSTLIS